jgi:hypothetical protein
LQDFEQVLGRGRRLLPAAEHWAIVAAERTQGKMASSAD